MREKIECSIELLCIDSMRWEKSYFDVPKRDFFIQFVSTHLIDKIFLDRLFLSYMYGHWFCKAMIDVLEYQHQQR